MERPVRANLQTLEMWRKRCVKSTSDESGKSETPDLREVMKMHSECANKENSKTGPRDLENDGACWVYKRKAVRLLLQT